MEYIGNINKKLINGKIYHYHQYRRDGKMITKTISEEEAYDLSFKISYSKENNLDEFLNHQFKTDLSFGLDLFYLEKQYRIYKRRYAFQEIENYINNANPGKVLILYGLRRTGKTTLIFQTLLSLNFKEHSKAAFIRINRNNTFYDLKEDLDYLTTHGFKYIFIDEVTLLDDFISIASIFSDIYGTRSKIFLSGTDSLGLYIAKFDELFDRAIFIHTTYISYKEFSDVLNIDSIDKYIEYGGTMSLDTNEYNNTPLSDDNYQSYIDSAIAHNITHSLKNYRNGDHFSHLFELYEKGELNNVINRVVEDQNHRFAISVINKEFNSHDLGSLRSILSKSTDQNVSNALKYIDENAVIETLMKALRIINEDKQTVPVTNEVMSEIKSYLDILDVIKEVDEVNIKSSSTMHKDVVIQPGIRYSQAKQLLQILLNEEHVKQLPRPILEIVKDKLINDIKGKMLEEIVLYQTSLANPSTFKLTFSVGEFDMVSIDPYGRFSSIFEIKHSDKINEKQYTHINDQSKIEEFERKYFKIKHRVVLYRGKDSKIEGTNIQYLNVENFLKNGFDYFIDTAIECYIDNNIDLFDVESAYSTSFWIFLYYFTFIKDNDVTMLNLLEPPKERSIFALIETVLSEKTIVNGTTFIDYLRFLREQEDYDTDSSKWEYYHELILIQRRLKEDEFLHGIKEGLKKEFYNMCDCLVPIESQTEPFKMWKFRTAKRLFDNEK